VFFHLPQNRLANIISFANVAGDFEIAARLPGEAHRAGKVIRVLSLDFWPS
jgi:hypothetical protein